MLGGLLVNESVIGTVFTGEAPERTAHNVGFTPWVADPEDSAAAGFFPR